MSPSTHPNFRTAGLAHLSLLQELWLGRNRVAEIGQGLEQLRCLRRLSLQSNRLTSMAGLQHCTALEELYLRCEPWASVGLAVGISEGAGWQVQRCTAARDVRAAMRYVAARDATPLLHVMPPLSAACAHPQPQPQRH